MTSRRVLWCSMAALLGALAAPSHAQQAGETQVVCPRVASPPTMDARLDDWPPLPQAVMAATEDWHPAAAESAHYGGPEDVSLEVRLAWDSRALYLALETRDDVLERVRSASEIDRGDSLVLTFAGEGSEVVNQFVVALLRGASLVWRAQPATRAGEVKTMSRALWARQDQDAGWRVTYELALPWSELAPLRPLAGQEIMLAISACDDDGHGLEGCLERTLVVTLAPDAMGVAVGAPRPAALAPVFAQPEISRFDRRALMLNNQPQVLFGGELDYARLPRELWGERLALLKAAGMNTVAVTAPWAHHQPTPDPPDFRDLAALLDLCAQEGLWVQLNLGPYAGDTWEAGGVPGWMLARRTAVSEQEAVAAWYRALLPLAKERQLAAGGPIVAVVVRPLPDAAGAVAPSAIHELIGQVQAAGVGALLLTANAPVARDNTRQSLANLLDTLALYRPVGAAELMAGLRALAREENGPAVLSAIPAAAEGASEARARAALVKAALGAGVAGVVVADFAPGLSPSAPRRPDQFAAPAVIDPAGVVGASYGELWLVGGFLRQFGSELARATAAEGVVKADDPEVQVAVRLAERTGFIFLWDEKGTTARQVRLSYTQPGSTRPTSIPEAGAIALPASGAKVIVLDAPLGRGRLAYSTSEVAAIHQLGDRLQLVVYGEADTPGELALGWPGPPLVWGKVTRQRWDQERGLLVLDYYHTRQDQHLLVDELEIVILSRERAMTAATIPGDGGAVTLSAGARVAGASLTAAGLEVALDCPAGQTQVSAALPRAPRAVLVDGEPVDFTFTTPARVLGFTLTTQSFREEGGRTVLDRLGRALLGGPPRLAAEFDRGWFMPDVAASDGLWRAAASLGRPPEDLGLIPGRRARLRARFQISAPARPVWLTLAGSDDPALVFVNGRLVPELAGRGGDRTADVTALLSPGANQLALVLHVLPRASGYRGLHEDKRLPEISLSDSSGPIPIEAWEASPCLAGEAAGWPGPEVDVSQWHLLRFGGWRRQGRQVEDVQGVGWYRVTFGLPQSREWRIPYYLELDVRGAAAVYLNGQPVASLASDGRYRLPLPAPPLRQGGANAVAVAMHGLAPDVGLHGLAVRADRERMTKRRSVTIQFE